MIDIRASTWAPCAESVAIRVEHNWIASSFPPILPPISASSGLVRISARTSSPRDQSSSSENYSQTEGLTCSKLGNERLVLHEFEKILASVVSCPEGREK